MDDKNNGWVKLYHPSGALVTLPVSPEITNTNYAATSYAVVTAYLDAGWLVNLPGIEAGETVEEIRWIVRREKDNDDQTTTPVIDLYPPRANFRLMGLYLNDENAIRQFQAACRVTLEQLPLYESGFAIERGKNTKFDKFVVQLKCPVKIVWKQNPKWEGDDDKKHSKRVFVRWHDAPVVKADESCKHCGLSDHRHTPDCLWFVEMTETCAYHDGTYVDGSNEKELAAYNSFCAATLQIPENKDALREFARNHAKP